MLTKRCVWTQKTHWTVKELSSFCGVSLKIASVYRGSVTRRQCMGQRWARLLFLFHLWSKHFTYWHTPIHSQIVNIGFSVDHIVQLVDRCKPVICIDEKWHNLCLKEIEINAERFDWLSLVLELKASFFFVKWVCKWFFLFNLRLWFISPNVLL